MSDPEFLIRAYAAAELAGDEGLIKEIAARLVAIMRASIEPTKGT